MAFSRATPSLLSHQSRQIIRGKVSWKGTLNTSCAPAEEGVVEVGLAAILTANTFDRAMLTKTISLDFDKMPELHDVLI
jgi:hypothetical protein